MHTPGIGEIGGFAWAVLSNWLLWIGGGLMTLVALWERKRSREIRWSIYSRLLVSLLLCAFFSAWKEAKDETQKAHAAYQGLSQELIATQNENASLRTGIEERQRQINAISTRPIPKEERIITPTQANELAQRLRSFAGHRMAIRLIQATNESLNFGRQLQTALKAAGIDVVSMQAMPVFSATGSYIPSISFGLSSSKDRKLAEVLGQSLVDLGVIRGPNAMEAETSPPPASLTVTIYPLG